ncbi:MAG: cobalt/nickel transport protein [Halobacteriales archaeon]|jgi:cobalt/nickel transport protein
MSDGRRYAILAALLFAGLVLGTVVLPGGWGGADGSAEAEIERISSGYEPWFAPVWTPPSGEIESLLFSLQAAIGGLGIGYYLGRSRGPADDRTRSRDASRDA